jgi:hypothetical protein
VLGPVGLALIVVGVIAGFFGTVRSERSLDSETLGRVRAAQAKLWISIVVIALALGVSYVMRIQGYARLGLTICVAVLVANAIVARFVKVRLAANVLDGDQLRRYRPWVALDGLGFTLLLICVYLYLLR